MAADTPPICTVYVRNLQERVPMDYMENRLRLVYSRFGNVVEVVQKRNLRAKGQAFVVFDRPEPALQAVQETNGFDLLNNGKPMAVALARTPSDATVQRLGSATDLDTHKRHRMARKDQKKATEALQEQKRQLKRGAPAELTSGRPVKTSKGAGLKSTGGGANAVIPDEYLPPNKILFVQNLPDEYDVEALTAVFGRFDGFREVRLVPGRRGIAFVEYDSEGGAITAKENTAGMAVGDEGKAMKVTYQRQ